MIGNLNLPVGLNGQRRNAWRQLQQAMFLPVPTDLEDRSRSNVLHVGSVNC